jgi:hypothetical protein
MIAAVAKQIRFIKHSCKAYDEGYTDEAIRIATQIRVILNPGGKRQRSLLQHLNAGRTPLLSTCEGASEDRGIIDYFGLGSFRFSSDGTTATGKYYPGLDNALTRQEIRADRWWKQVVFVFDRNTRLSREMIVKAAANTDGGAHVAQSLTPEYQKLSAPGAIGDLVETFGGTETRTPVTDAHLVAIRQMGYELLHSPELLKLTAQ